MNAPKVLRPSVIDLVQANLIKLDAAREPVLARSGVAQANQVEVGGWRIFPIDIAAGVAGLLPVPVMASGFGFAIFKAGSDPIAVAVDAAECGKYGPVYPGVGFSMGRRFSHLVLKGWGSATVPPAGSSLTGAGCYIAAGRLTVGVAMVPDARPIVTAQDLPGFITGRSGVQAYNSVANVPVSALEGVNVRGASSARVSIAAAGGGTITGGTIVWWWYDPLGATGWMQTDVSQALPLGTNLASCGEVQIGHRYGRYFPEVRNLTTSFGSGSCLTSLYAYGEGGELAVGDVQP